MSATIQRDARCALCGELVALVDEHDRCERCMIDAEHVATELTEYLEGTVAELLRDGLVTVEQLRGAFELTLANAAGTVPGLGLMRRPVTTRERGMWEVAVPSAWLEGRKGPAKNIGHLRNASRLTLEELAERLGVTPQDVALWERGATPPEGYVRAMSEMWAVSADYILGLDRDYEEDD